MDRLAYDDEDFNLALLLLKLRRFIAKAREKELSQYGLTRAQSGILYVAQATGERSTPAEISRLVFREPHTISSLIDRMGKAGLVKKAKDLPRKNQVRVTITEKGRQAYLQSAKRETTHKIMSALSKEEREQLKIYLEKLTDKAKEVLGELYHYVID